MAVIKDVAHRADLSVSAVSKYLKRPDSVRPDTRKRIEQAIKELNYVPSAAARSLRTGLTGMLMVICPNISNPFFAELFGDIQRFASGYGYTCILQTQDGQHSSLLMDRLAWNGSIGVDGIIVCFPDDDAVVDLIDRQCPKAAAVYLTWHPLSERVRSAVLLDVEDGLYIATKHLISLGHRVIGYIGAPIASITSVEKFKGYASALREAGLDATPEYAFHGPYGLDTGYRAAAHFFQCAYPPTAAVTESDVFAIGCLKYCLRNAISVPGEMAVTGFDDVPMAYMYEPPLTTVRLPLREMARAAVEKLHAQVAGRDAPAAQNPVFKASLVVRKSTNPDFEE